MEGIPSISPVPTGGKLALTLQPTNKPSEIENQLLPKTAHVIKSSVQEKIVAGQCPSYSRTNNFFEVKVEVSNMFHVMYSHVYKYKCI